MKKTFLKRGIFVFFLLLQMAQGRAQAYEFTCEKMGDDFWFCYGNINIKENVTRIGIGSTEMLVIVSFRLGLIASGHFYKEVGANAENVNIKLFLTNGEIFTTIKGAAKNANGAITDIFIPCYLLKSNKTTFTDNAQTALYCISQLRKNNITKIAVNGHEYTIPKSRSAATIDAMCKKLITKTGDQGQYGGNTSTSSSSATNSSSSISLLPLTINGYTSGYNAKVPGKKDHYVYSVKTRNGQYVKDTKLGDYTVASDFYWTQIKRKTESNLEICLSII